MQTQSAMTATVTVAEINPIVSTPPGLITPNYTVSTDSSIQNLKSEQEAISAQSISGPGSKMQMQPVNQVNFTGTVGYTSVRSGPHMFSNQPTTSFTSSKHRFYIIFLFILYIFTYLFK